MNILYGVIFALLGLSWGAPPRNRRNVEEERSAVQPPLRKEEFSRDSVARLLSNKAALKHREQPIAPDEGPVKQLKPVARLAEAPVQEADSSNRHKEKLVVEDSRDIIQLGDVKELPSGVKADEGTSRVLDEYIDVMSRFIEDNEPVEHMISSKAEATKDDLVLRPEDQDVRGAGVAAEPTEKKAFKKVAQVAVSEVIVKMTGEKEKEHPEPLESADRLKATEVKMDGVNVVLEKSDSLLSNGDSVFQIQISLKKPGTMSVPLTLTAERPVIELTKTKDQPSHADQTKLERPASSVDPEAPSTKPRDIVSELKKEKSSIGDIAVKDQTADKKHLEEIESQDKTKKEQGKAQGPAKDWNGQAPAPAEKVESPAKDDKETAAEKPRPTRDHDFSKEGITITVTAPMSELELPVKKDQTAGKKHSEETENQNKIRKEQGKAEGLTKDGDVQAPAAKLESSAKDDKVTASEKLRPAMDHDFRKEGITITVTAPISELELPVKNDQTAGKKHSEETENQGKLRKEQGKAEGPTKDGDVQAPAAKLESSAKDDKVTAAEKLRPAMDHDFRKEGITITVTAPMSELELPVKKDQTAGKKHREETENQDKIRKEQGKAEGPTKDGDGQAPAAKLESSAKDDKVTAAEKLRPAMDHDFRKEGITITVTAPMSELELPVKKDQTAGKKHREEIESQDKTRKEQGKAESRMEIILTVNN